VVVHSATLRINEEMQARRARGEPVVHLGFGEAGLPVLPEVAEVLRRSSEQTSYAPVTGSLAARTAVAGYLDRRGVPTGPGQVLLAPGSKPLLFALMSALPGDVVLPVPSWVSYAAQAALAGKRVVPVTVPAPAGGVPDPDLMRAALADARAGGAEPGILVLTLPDNPTGTTADADTVARVSAVAAEEGLAVVADEIYRDLVEDPAGLVGPAAVLDDRVVVTGGLSKNLALGGWRIGFARTPDTAWGEELRDRLVGVASEVWSCPATPMDAVAAYAFAEPDVVTTRIEASRRLHLAVSQATYDVFADAGATCRRPTAAFYLYPDLEALRPGFERHGATTAASAAALMLERYGIGVLPGEAFGDDPDALRFRVATSLLYGDGDRRLEALASPAPAKLPWIADTLDVVRAALQDLASAG